MKAKAYFGTLMILALAVSASSCEKLGLSREIRFRAATVVSGGAIDTRTVYSGDVYSGNERIDWAAGDVIRVASDKAQTEGGEYYSDYIISGNPSAEGIISKADLGASGEHGLEWGSGTHHFWGIYPSHTLTVSGGSASVTGLSISATQNIIDDASHKTSSSTLTAFAPDMSSAWMLADAPGIAESTSALDLDFYPAFTAFQFNIASQFDATITVTAFTLSSSDRDIAGTFDATLATAGASTYDNFSGSHDITVGFGTGVEITQSKALEFTVLALPREISNLSITFDFVVNGAAVSRSLALKTVSPDAFITFPACKKHKFTGMVLPSGALKMTVGVAEWTVGAADYNYISPVATSMRCLSGDKYRRYDSDADYTSWAGSNIVVSYGYRNDSNETIITDNPQEYQEQEHTLLRPAYSPILELATTTDPSTVLELQLDNPHFKFIQYGTDSYGNIDLSVRDHSKEDHLDIISGSGVKTFFSVVPVEQFAIDASDAEKTCRVFLLSVSPGTLHEIPFNMTDDPAPVQALPGEDMNDLMFIYFGPAAYGTTGNEVTP